MSEKTFEPGQLAVLKNNKDHVVTVVKVNDHTKAAECVNMDGLVVGIPLIALLPYTASQRLGAKKIM